MKLEKHSTQTMINIKGNLSSKDSFKALLVTHLAQIIASFGVVLLGVAAVVAAIKG